MRVFKQSVIAIWSQQDDSDGNVPFPSISLNIYFLFEYNEFEPRSGNVRWIKT